MYNTERATSGIYALHQRQNESDSPSMTTLIFMGADAGTLKAEIELAYQRGTGDLPGGINDITLSSFGGILDVNLTADRLRLGIVGGFAQGDSDPNDKTLKTFYFNPDYNLSLMLLKSLYQHYHQHREFVNMVQRERDTLFTVLYLENLQSQVF